MPSISTHVLFYLMQEFAYSFNHAAANRLTEWHGNFNKRWIRGNKGKHILLHIINKEKIAKKNKNSAWIFIKIQLKKKNINNSNNKRILFALQRENISWANTGRSKCRLLS